MDTLLIFVVMSLPMTAKTECNPVTGRPEITITDSAFNSPDEKYTILHERTHIKQMNANGGCVEATKKYIEDADFRAEMELDAYCTEANAMVADGKTLEHFVPNALGDGMKFPFYFFLVYKRNLTARETNDWIKPRCPTLADSTM